ncbi:tRNA synthetase, partial [Oryctes borbonicus]
FLKLYDAGLVYQRKAQVNWDPVDKTVLADEQVDENGNAWRSGAKVEKKYLKQWFIRTTRFAKELYDGLNSSILEDWRDITKLQRHWIGDCDGVTFDCKIQEDGKLLTDFIRIWVPNPEQLENVQFITINKSNIYADYEGKIMENGVKKLYITAENPITKDSIPIFVETEDFENGMDHKLGIPVSDEAEELFARYNVNFRKIEDSTLGNPVKREAICKKARDLNQGGYWTSSKLKDWLISRQRYWGTPIPIIHCKSCGPQPVPQNDLPVLLPEINSFASNRTSPIEYKNWLHTRCPICEKEALRETDTLDTFFDSSWYYLRYLDSKNQEEIFDKDKIKKQMPVDLYIGGKEHATLHLYYARFISYFLHSIGLVPTQEPFKRLLVQGMVMGRSFRLKGSGKYVNENEVDVLDAKKNKAIHRVTKNPVSISWEKMSKSKHNGVDPSEMFEQYGVDTTRLLIMADVAPTSHRHWNSNTFPGILNWQRRLWLTIQDFLKHRRTFPKAITEEKFKSEDDYMFDSRNYYIKGATFNYCQSQQMSVALSKMQGLTNSLRRVSPFTLAKSPQYERALAAQIILLAPMAPHFASELWSGFLSAEHRISDNSEIDWDADVLQQKWPDVDYNYNLELVCQVNGCDNAAIKYPRKDIEVLSKEDALRIALEQNEVQQLLKTRTILDVKYAIHYGYENVLNILTDQPPPKNKE